MSVSPFVRITVTSPEGKVLVNDTFEIPVTIGREKNSCQVTLPDPDRRISRIHAVIHEKDGTLELNECSLNGSEYNGQQVSKTRIKLKDTDEFAIFGFRIRVRRALDISNRPTVFQLHLKGSDGSPLADESGNTLTPVDIGPYYLMFLINDSGKISFKVIPYNANHKDILNRINRDKLHWFLMVYPNGTVADLRRQQKHEHIRIYLNNRRDLPGTGLVGSGHTCRIEPMDVVTFGDYRLEMASTRATVIECQGCGLLNANNQSANCRWCGYHMVNTGYRN